MKRSQQNKRSGWDEALRRIEERRRNQSTSLDLCSLGLESLPDQPLRLSGLAELDLSDNPLADATVRTLAEHCPGLQSLDLSGCDKITDAAVLPVAEHCPGLQSLDLSGCDKITDAAVLAVAEHCPGLQSLFLRECDNITKAAVRALAEHCPGLQSLNLVGCDKITDAAVLAVAEHCPGLRSLDLSGCYKINDAAVRALAEHCPALQSLNLVGCDKITDAAVRALAKHCPGLQSLDLSSCDKVTDAAVHALAMGCPGLEWLDLSWCKQITDSSVRPVARHCPGLRSLDLSSCDKITDAAMHALAMGCPGLEWLDLSQCDKITDSAVWAVAKHCPGLQSLDLSSCDKITDAAVHALAVGCPGLEWLDLSWCDKITDAAIRALGEHCPGLRSLDLSFCDKITDAAIRDLGEHCPGLRSLCLQSCNKITAVPEELRDGGDAQAIFEALKDGTPLNEAKLVLLGDGGNGKTNISLRLRGRPFNPRHNETHDFEIADWSVEVNPPGAVGKRRIVVRILDFAGQDVTHATHQFFLTNRCVYLLVLDGTRSVEDNRVEYWLRLIRHFAGSSPLLIAVTKTDVEDDRRLNAAELDRNLSEVCPRLGIAVPQVIGGVSAKTPTSIDRLDAAIREHVARMDTLDQRVPQTFRRLRGWYEDEMHFATWEELDEYERRCSSNDFGIEDPERQATYLALLHEFVSAFHWGEATWKRQTPDHVAGPGAKRSRANARAGHWDEHCGPSRDSLDPFLCRRLIRPAWLKQRVYAVIRQSEWIEAQKGILRLDRVIEWLQHMGLAPVDQRAQFDEVRMVLAAMKRFELCFELENNQGALLPSCLSDDELFTGNWPDGAIYLGEFEFLPPSVVHRLIVRLHGKSSLAKDTYWRLGLVASNHDGSVTALVRADLNDRTILMCARGGDGEAQREFIYQLKGEIVDIHCRTAGVTPDEAITWTWVAEPASAKSKRPPAVPSKAARAKSQYDDLVATVPRAAEMSLKDLFGVARDRFDADELAPTAETWRRYLSQAGVTFRGKRPPSGDAHSAAKRNQL